MMKRNIAGLLCFFSLLSVQALDWQCKDGTGNRVVKDLDATKLHLFIRTPDKVDWAREDDRGFFLSYNGGVVSRPMTPKMNFPDGMEINIRFSVKLQNARAEKTHGGWLPLITAQNYDKGYAVWVRKDGYLLVAFPGTTNWYKSIDARILEMRDYDLRIIRGEERVQVILNNNIVADYPSKGKVKDPGPNAHFYLGSLGSRTFFGNIYFCSIKPFKKGSFIGANTKKNAGQQEVFSGDEVKDFKTMNIKDPAGTVILSDFSKFSPRPQNITGHSSLYGWSWRKCPFFLPQAPGALYSPMDPKDMDILSYAPGLKGNYDVYLGLRINSFENDLVFAVPNEQTRYRVQTGRAGPSLHPNTEILIAKNVRMDGGKVAFFPGSRMFLGYVKLIPSNNPRKVDVPKWKCVSVTPTKEDCSDRINEEIRAVIKSGRLVERHFVGATTTKNITAASRKRGYVLFPHDWMDLCFEHVAPAVDPGKFTLKLKAAKGEFEPVTLGVHGLENLGKITFTGGEKFKKAGIKVDIATALSMPKRTTNYSKNSEFVVAPQCLERTNIADLKKGRTKQFWITVKVPENMKAGIYRDNFVLTSSKGKEIVPVELEVRPFKLDSIGKNRTALFNRRTLWKGKFDYHNVIREMADHGLNTLIVVEMINDLIPWKFDADGRVQIDPKNPEAVKLIKVMKDAGIKTIILATQTIVFDLYGKKHADENFLKIVSALQKLVKENNGPEIYFYGMDEVLSNMSWKYKQAVWETKLLKQLNAKLFHVHLWYKTARPIQKELDVLSPHVDVFCVRYNTRNLWYVDSWEEIQKEAHKRGKELWSYNADNAVQFSQTGMKRFAYGWFFRTTGEKTCGQTMWEYHAIYGNPYTDLDYDHTDWAYVYPANMQYKGGYSLEYEATREGVDDLRYICTLENSIASAKKRGIDTTSAEKLLSDLKKSFDFGENFKRKSPFLTSSFEKQWTANGKRYCSGPYNLPNGWSFADYHSAREKIAAEIIKLNQK